MSEVILVDIEQGRLKGGLNKNYYGETFYQFLGVPYAKPPIGELRFKAPEPAEPWNGIFDATKDGPECPSPDMYLLYFIGNENNCLNLNIYTKELPQQKNLNKPVMVWIHGGGFTTGSNKISMYGPDYLMTQDVVLVSINYRLGILGFASFKDESLNIPGNAGLKDMREALKWIQKNIKKFGGDPNNVTIFGESAGAASVHYLTLAPSTEGLFHKAIIQSGSALNNWSWGETNSKKIAQYLGYKDVEDETKIFEKLKRESARNIVGAMKKHKEIFSAGANRPFGPVVEPASAKNAFLQEHPLKIIHTRGGHKIPIIMGYTSKEGILFELVRRTVPGVDLPKEFVQELPYELNLDVETAQKLAEQLKTHYFNDEDCNEENIHHVYQLKGDASFIYPIHKTIRLQAKHSHEPVFAYRMSLKSSLNFFHSFATAKYFKTIILCTVLTKLSGSYLPFTRSSVQSLMHKIPKKDHDGVSHADDVFYLFSTYFTPEIKRDSAEDLYIQRFVKLWTNFAKYGHPTPQETDEILNHCQWKATNRDDDNVEFLEIGADLQMIEDVDKERLSFWDKIYDKHLIL